MKPRETQGEFLTLSGTRAATPEVIPPAPHVYRVGELTREIRTLLEGRFSGVLVEGEICNYRLQSSGHHYFSLKDEDSQVGCVLFRASAGALRGFKPAEGLLVQIKGDISVYAARGQYQLIVREMRLCGAGQLQARFDALKEKLRREGLFDEARKRSLPRFPRRIGLITSPTGAALQDFLKVLKRRFPADILLAPVRVQGEGASLEIAAALRLFASPGKVMPPVDLIVLIRGGGSTEDLWEFNEEIVARAIAESSIPVLTGIGHETDFTIADFVADFRAPTPSAAAAAALPDRGELTQRIRALGRTIHRDAGSRLTLLRTQLESLSRTGVFREPLRRIAEARQETDRRLLSIHSRIERRIESERQHVRRIQSLLRVHAPDRRLAADRQRLALAYQRLQPLPERLLREFRSELERRARMLAALDPKGVLARGFTMTLSEKGRPLTAAKQAREEKRLRTVFSDGEVISEVRE